MTMLQLGLIGVAVFAGAVIQRLTGLGFAMVAAPLLTLVLGPFEGVLLANILTFLLTFGMFIVTWRRAEPRRLALLVPAAILAALAGAPLGRLIPSAWMLTISGALVLGALILVMTMRHVRLFRGRIGALAAGAISGFMNATSGVGGAAITLYAMNISWEQASFYASMQVYLAVLNLASFLPKGLPHLGQAVGLVVVAALALGFAGGHWLARLVSLDGARKGAVCLALAGAAATLAKGVYQMAG
nr:TSUP family transporter [uncultured Acidocella sp.]